MLPTCFLLQSRFVPQLPRLTRASVQSKAGMIFATAEYTPPEYTPPGWTREQFMEYFAGVVEVSGFPIFDDGFIRHRILSTNRCS